MSVVVFVCRKCDGGRRLADHLAGRTDASVRLVGCQRICSHHVVGVRRAGARLTWFKKVDTKRRRRALREFIAADATTVPDKRLRRLTVERRSGRLR